MEQQLLLAAAGPSKKKSESNKKFHRENKSPAIPSCPCKLYQGCAVNMMVGWPSIEDEERRKGKRFFLFCFVLFFSLKTQKCKSNSRCCQNGKFGCS